MDQFNESKQRLLQRCVPALRALTESQKLDFTVDTTLNDDDFKVEIETKIAQIEQFSESLVKFVKDINEERYTLKHIAESITDAAEGDEARKAYLIIMQSEHGPVECLTKIDTEITRLHNERSRMQGYLDAVNTRLSLTNGGSTVCNPHSIRITSMLPTLSTSLSGQFQAIALPRPHPQQAYGQIAPLRLDIVMGVP